MIMELLRDAVLTICRQTFSKYGSGELKVKCQIEVSTNATQIFSTSFEDVLCGDSSADNPNKICACHLKESVISPDKDSCFVCRRCRSPCDSNNSKRFTVNNKHKKSQVKLNCSNSTSALNLQRQGGQLSGTECLQQHDVTKNSMDLSNSSENLEIVAVDDFFGSAVDQNLTSSDVSIFNSDSHVVGDDNKSAHSCTSPLHCDISHKMLQIHNSKDISSGRSSKAMDDAITQKSEYQLSSSEDDLWHMNVFHDDNSSSNDRAKKFACSHCECSFSMLTNLRRHIKKVHHNIPVKSPVKSSQVSLNLPAKGETLSKPGKPLNDIAAKKNCRYRHVCSVCKAVFTFRTNLTRHIKKIHGHVPQQSANN